MDKRTVISEDSVEKFLEGAKSDKLFCRIVSEAVGGVIRHSMENAGRFRQQCYELLQVTSTKDAETELERRLLNITLGEIGTRKNTKQSQETNTDELQLDRSSLNWDTVAGEQSSASADRWLTEVEDWS